MGKMSLVIGKSGHLSIFTLLKHLMMLLKYSFEAQIFLKGKLVNDALPVKYNGANPIFQAF